MGGPLSLVDNSATAAGLTTAATAQPDPSWNQTWDAVRQQVKAVGQTNSTSYYESDFYDQLAKRLNDAGFRFNTNPGMFGTARQIPFGQSGVSRMYDPLGYRDNGGDYVTNQYWAAVDAAHAKGQLKDVPNRDAHEKAVNARMAADGAQANDVLSRAHGIWGKSAQFLGSAFQGMQDPAQAAMMVATEGAGMMAEGLSGAGGVTGRMARFMAPNTTGAGVTGAGAATRAALGNMTREGTVFAAGNAAMLPALHENDDRAGIAHDASSDLEQVGSGFLMGAGFAALGPAAKVTIRGGVAATKAAGWAAGKVGGALQSVMERLYPGMAPETQAALAARAGEAGTEGLRTDLAGAVDAAAASPATTPVEQDSIRHGASSAIDAEVNPYLGEQGAETHGSMLAAHRSAMALGQQAPGIVASPYAAVTQNPVGTFITRVRGVESGGNDAARAATSTATGRYQFVDRTWKTFYRKAFPGDASSDAAILARRGDGAVQDRVMAVAAQDYTRVLHEAGVPVTPTNLYLVHFAGERGAQRLFSAHPDASAESVMGSAAVKANPFLEGMSARDVVQWAERKMGQAHGEAIPDLSMGADERVPGDPSMPVIEDDVPMPAINPERVGEHVPAMPAMTVPDDRPVWPQMVDTGDLIRSPDFQFRSEASPMPAMDIPVGQHGTIDVFERNDGTRVIVDGHGRVAAAEGEAGGPTQIQAHVMREADGWTLPEMQAAAIIRNLIEGAVSEVDRARIYEANPKLRRMIEDNGYEQGRSENPGGHVAAGDGDGAVAGAGERRGNGAPADRGAIARHEHAEPVSAPRGPQLNRAADFSDPAGAAAQGQAEQLGHDWLRPEQEPKAEGENALAPPPPMRMPDLKSLKAEDAFMVNGIMESMRAITREIEREDAAIAELRGCL